MNDNKSEIMNTGLRGVTIASSKISDVIGKEGKLIYRGYLIKDLGDNCTFEETVYLLLFEKLPDKNELVNFTKRLRAGYTFPGDIMGALQTMPADSLPMDILQAGVSMLANNDTGTKKAVSFENSAGMGINLISKIPVIIAAWKRIRNNQEPIAPDPELSHAANFLYMLSGEKPDEELTKFMDTCLVLHAEHSFNASTFAAREVASTRAHIYASIGAAVGSLSGALHGGANTRVMQMLKKIGSEDAVEDFLETELNAGNLIMGLGHAVYKVDDPRALILAPMSKRMGERKNETKWYEISKRLEQKAKEAFKKRKNMDIFVNVDYYSASLYYTMGIPIDLFTPVFAVSRIAGWVSHVLEEQFAGAAPKPVIYRPDSEYIGDYCGPEECKFVTMDKR